MIDQVSLNNDEKVSQWYFGVQKIFSQIQFRNNWTKQEAWEVLKQELVNSIDKKDFVPDDLEWVKDLLLHNKKPSTEEAMRVSKRYIDKTPLLDSLAKFV